MLRLDDLPLEIVLLILSHVLPDDIPAFACTSRRFYVLLLDQLHHHKRLYERYHHIDVSKNFDKLLETFNNEDASLHVRRLRYSFKRPWRESAPGELDPRSKEFDEGLLRLSRMSHIVDGLSTGQYQTNSTTSLDWEWNKIPALLIECLPNLECLEMPMLSGTLVKAAMHEIRLKQGLWRCPPLQRLKLVSLNYEGAISDPCLEAFAAFYHLPNLQTYWQYRLVAEKGTTIWPDRDQKSNITFLVFK